jgi:hypothetical protein
VNERDWRLQTWTIVGGLIAIALASTLVGSCLQADWRANRAVEECVKSGGVPETFGVSSVTCSRR